MSTLTYEKILEAMAKLPPRPFIRTPVTPPALVVCHNDHLDEVKALIADREGIEVRGTEYIDPEMVYIIDLTR